MKRLSLLLLIASCRGSPAVVPAPVAENVASITLGHTIGGWGDGADYTFTLLRDGTARYEGGLRAVFAGKYEGRMSQAAQHRALAALAEAVPTPEAMTCYDMVVRYIVVEWVQGGSTRYDAYCLAPDVNRAVVDALFIEFREVEWAAAPEPPS